uniref:Uncharacterized protein n=1 Tax=Sinocyclocheilus anshuiensis TaxID=1608454 RepID=A0A671Q9R3_9TELE
MFAIQPVCLINSDEELRAVSIGTRVCHRQQTYEHTDKVLIIKLASIYGFPPSAIVVGKISTLAHKLRNDSMEAAALESKAFLICDVLRHVAIDLLFHIVTYTRAKQIIEKEKRMSP